MEEEETVTLSITLTKPGRMTWEEATELQNRAVRAVEDTLWAETKITEINIT